MCDIVAARVRQANSAFCSVMTCHSMFLRRFSSVQLLSCADFRGQGLTGSWLGENMNLWECSERPCLSRPLRMAAAASAGSPKQITRVTRPISRMVFIVPRAIRIVMSRNSHRISSIDELRRAVLISRVLANQPKGLRVTVR